MIRAKKLLSFVSSHRIIILSAIVIAFIGIFCTQITLQNDTFYTIKIGEHIAQAGVDSHDPFSWHDLSYTYPHWLYDYLSYLIYHQWGFVGIYYVTCLLSATLGILLYYINRRLCHSNIIAFVTSAIAIVMMAPFLAARAQLVTYILFLLTVYFIERFVATKAFRYAVGLVIIPLLIANLHAAVYPFYFVLFLPTIAELIASKILNKLDKDKTSKLRTVINNKVTVESSQQGVLWCLIAIIIAGILVGLLTPIGNTPYTYLIKTMAGNTTAYISEHLPSVLAAHIDILVVILAFTAILLFTHSKIKLRDLFMTIGLTLMMIMSSRQTSLFILIGSIAFSRITISFIGLKLDHDKVAIKVITSLTAGLAIILPILFIISVITTTPTQLASKIVDKNTYPVEATNYISSHINLSKARFYNEYFTGSYLLFRGIPVFIDSRADLYTPEFNSGQDIFTESTSIEKLSDRFYGYYLDKYDFTHLLLTRGTPLDLVIAHDNHYNRIYTDNQFVIYQRVSRN